MKFEFALTNLLKNEGYYSNHPNDKGGETWRGIARRYHPDWKGWEIVDGVENKKTLEKNNNLQNLVHDFYYTKYWGNLSGLREITIASDVFSAEVLHGKGQGVRLLQQAYNVLNSHKLEEDGLLGQKTLDAINLYNHVDSLAHTYKGEWYIKVKMINQPVFRRGWINRVFSLC